MLSLDQLPLNILFQILFYLDFQDLRNVSKTCKSLRILSNESISYSKYLNEKTLSNWWTKRLLHDFFEAMDQSRNVIMLFSKSNDLSIIDTLRDVQERMNLGPTDTSSLSGYRQESKTELDNELNKQFSSSSSADNDSSCGIGQDIDIKLKENNLFDDSFSSYEDDEDILEVTTKHMQVNLDRSKEQEYNENMGYLKVLQGFYNIAMYKKDKDDSFVDSCFEKPDKVMNPMDNIEKVMKPTNHTSDSLTSTSTDFLHSLDESQYSSNNDILSNSHKLEEHKQLFTHKLKNIPDSSDILDSNTSIEFIEKLRNSNKVKDKKVLFETLIARNNKDNPLNKNQRATSNDNIKYEQSLTNDISSGLEKKNFFQEYLEEVERCNPTQTELYHTLEKSSQKMSINDNISNFRDNLAHNYEIKLEDMKIAKEKFKKYLTTPHRRKLKAFVTDDNRICYEKF